MSHQLATISLSDPSSSWRAVGFEVVDDLVRIGPLTVALGRGSQRPAWGFEPSFEATNLGGIEIVAPETSSEATHRNGAIGVDHVVVRSTNLDETTSAFEAAGLEMRRSRSIGEQEQRFFWAGRTIIEMVGPANPSGDAQASIWGLALVSGDLDASKSALGDLLSEPRDAVQPGRRIAAIRTRDRNMSLTIALMTPHG